MHTSTKPISPAMAPVLTHKPERELVCHRRMQRSRPLDKHFCCIWHCFDW